MTTIVCDPKRKVMVSDSQLTYQYIAETGYQKIIPLVDKEGNRTVLVGFSGRPNHAHFFLDWLADGSKKENWPDQLRDDQIQILVLTDNGQIQLFENTPHPIILDECVAIGSGSDFAKAAMLAGATAEEAVSIASKLDPYTGGEIVTESIH